MHEIIKYFRVMKLGELGKIKNKYIHYIVQWEYLKNGAIMIDGVYPNKNIYEKLNKYYGIKNEDLWIKRVADTYHGKFAFYNLTWRNLDYRMFASLIYDVKVLLINFDSCNIGNSALELLVKCKLKTLKSIELMRNPDITNYAIEIMAKLDISDSFSNLTIFDCGVDSRGIKRITEIKKYKSLKYLNFKIPLNMKNRECQRKWFYNLPELKMITFGFSLIHDFEKMEFEKKGLIVCDLDDRPKKKKKIDSDNISNGAMCGDLHQRDHVGLDPVNYI